MYTVSKDVRSRHSQDGAVVLDVSQGQMFSVNLVGSKILQLLEAGFTEPEIVNAICHDFKTGSDVVERDVREFVNSLKLHKIISET
jgi:hypothetical protein